MTGPGAPGTSQAADENTSNEPRLIFVNERGRSIARGYGQWLTDVCRGKPCQVWLVTSFVSFRGLLQLLPTLQALLDQGCRVRLLIGVVPAESADIFVLPYETRSLSGEVHRLYANLHQALRGEIDGILQPESQALLLQDLGRLLTDPRVESRRYQRRYLHAKALIMQESMQDSGNVHAVIGSSNLTYPGLRTSEELNGPLAVAVAKQAAAKIRHWWERAEPYDLAELIRERLVRYPAELIFLRMLNEAHLDDVNAPASRIKLEDYQLDGVAAVSARLTRYHGVLLADSVGLGKTFIAGETARRALIRDRRVLIIAPASLQKMWAGFLDHYELTGCELISYDRLVRLWKNVRDHRHEWSPYSLVIVDEAHYVQNPRAKRMEALRSLLRACGPSTDVLLMTATPVNNRIGDLVELLGLADRRLDPGWAPAATFRADRQAGRSREGLALAMALRNLARDTRPQELSWVYDQLAERMVRRDPELLRKVYAASYAELGFPELRPVAVRYKLTIGMRRLLVGVLDAVGFDLAKLPEKMVTELARLRGHDRPDKALTLATYRRHEYLRQSAEVDVPGEFPSRLVLGMLRAVLCKRIESSPAAFASTARYMADQARTALTELDAGIVRIPVKESLLPNSWMLGETDAETEDLLDDRTRKDYREMPADLFDTTALRADLTSDMKYLQKLAIMAAREIPHDPKKRAMAELILTMLRAPGQQKMVIFSSSRETTADLGDWIINLVAADDRFVSLRGRIANLGTREKPSPDETAAIMARFAPETMRPPPDGITRPPVSDDFDILISTDLLAEGVNLQQAAFCVNYDLTWNPQRLGQRLGRVVRAHSRHSIVKCWTVLPDTGLDIVLKIMDTLTVKAEVAKVTVGIPHFLWPDSPFRTYTSMMQYLDPQDGPIDDPATEDHSRYRERFRDHGLMTAWLGQARRVDVVKEAIDTVPRIAGAVREIDNPNPSIVFCFRITGPNKASNAAFIHVRGRTSRGHANQDTNSCLRHARVDPTTWINQAEKDKQVAEPRTYPAHDDADLHLVWDLLDIAKRSVAEAHGIPAGLIDKRLHLITWMLLKPKKKRR